MAVALRWRQMQVGGAPVAWTLALAWRLSDSAEGSYPSRCTKARGARPSPSVAPTRTTYSRRSNFLLRRRATQRQSRRRCAKGWAQSWCRCGWGEPSPGEDQSWCRHGSPDTNGAALPDENVADRPHWGRLKCVEVRTVPAQMWPGRAQSRRRCGRGEPSPGADVAVPGGSHSESLRRVPAQARTARVASAAAARKLCSPLGHCHFFCRGVYCLAGCSTLPDAHPPIKSGRSM